MRLQFGCHFAVGIDDGLAQGHNFLQGSHVEVVGVIVRDEDCRDALKNLGLHLGLR